MVVSANEARVSVNIQDKVGNILEKPCLFSDSQDFSGSFLIRGDSYTAQKWKGMALVWPAFY
jgi:hypothetical protein